MPSSAHQLSRDEKVENLVVNFSMIMMGMFEGVFAALAAGMADALTKTAEALTEAMDSGSGPRKKLHAKVDMESEVDSKVKEVFSGLRKEVASGFSGRGKAFRDFVKDPAFDEGLRIIERHPLKLPKLTEPLSDSDLAGYVKLIQDGDPETAKMLQELGEWQKKTPHFDRD